MTIKGISENELLDLRDEALNTAARKLGERPDKKTYPFSNRVSDFPVGTVVASLFGVLLVLIFAANVSFQHIMEAAQAANEGVFGAGLSYAIMAEFTALVIMLTIDVLYPGRTGGKVLLMASLLLAVAIAFTGNYTAIHPDTVWEWLLVVGPPLFTLAMASVIERMTIRWQSDRAAWQRELRELQEAWDAKRNNMEGTPEYINSFANAIWQHLLKVNARGRNAKEVRERMVGMSVTEKRHIVSREMKRLDWYTNDANTPAVTAAEEGWEVDLPEDELGTIMPSRDGDGILGVTVTNRPSNDASPNERKSALRRDAIANPRMFIAHTREQIAAWYGISTGLVSNIKNEMIENGYVVDAT